MNAVMSTNERVWILTGHVTFKLRYNQIYQMKTPHINLHIHSLLGSPVSNFMNSTAPIIFNCTIYHTWIKTCSTHDFTFVIKVYDLSGLIHTYILYI